MRFGYDIITIGGLTEDLFFTVDEYRFLTETVQGLDKKMLAFEYGTKIGAPQVTAAYGGGANNAAVLLARLGFRVAIFGIVGNDHRGQGIIHNLKQQGVSCRYLETTPKSGSGVSFILVHTGSDHVVFTHRGANDYLALTPKMSKELKKAKGIYLTSLSGNWKQLLPRIFTGHNNIMWNPGRQQISAGLRVLSPFLQKTSILICNKEEALELVQSSKHTRAHVQLRGLLKELKEYVKDCVVITNGEHGSMAYDGKKYYSQKTIKAKKVADTTGVGDAFGATFFAVFQQTNGQIELALRQAAQQAALVVGQLGAQSGFKKKSN